MPRRHLSRLEEIWLDAPVFFVTTCTHKRRRVLANEQLHQICRECWQTGQRLHGWSVGKYVLMPDHVHFFCTPCKDRCPLEDFVGKWKEWTAKFARRRLSLAAPLWQAEFFDHVLRSDESYEQKWEYVRGNPLRAGLVNDVEAWPYQGELSRI